MHSKGHIIYFIISFVVFFYSTCQEGEFSPVLKLCFSFQGIDAKGKERVSL